MQSKSNLNENMPTNLESPINDNNFNETNYSKSLKYTVGEAIERFGFGKFQIFLTFFAGLAWMADAMEMMILTILSPALICEWHINTFEQAMITTCVFGGMVFSSSIWGMVCDRYGRKLGLFLIEFFTFLLGLASSFAPNFNIFLILRMLTGVCIGGLPQAVTYYLEFLPMKQRAVCVVFMQVFWAIGGVFGAALGLFIMEPLGWRWFLIFSSIPLLFSAASCVFVPESPRFLITSGRVNDAYDTLKKIAQLNNKELPEGELSKSLNGEENRGHIMDLFKPQFMKTTILILIIWFVAALSYYGILLYTTTLFLSNDTCRGGQITQTNLTSINETDLSCKPLTHKQYLEMVYISFSEFPALFLTAFIIEIIGRKKTMAFNFIIFTVSVLVLSICINNTFTSISLFMARGFISAAFQGAYVYTPEIYPTSIRAVGLGTASGASRIGALITPFIAQYLAEKWLLAPIFIYSILGVVALISSICLPIETKGLILKDQINSP